MMSDERVPILIASGNPHKREEIQAAFESESAGDAPGFSLLTLADLGRVIDEPIEDQPTFEGNGALKAKYYATQSGLLCLADDSGLEVDALGGEPGVISARYSGETGPRSVVDPANNLKLMTRLGQTPAADRVARFVCAMALAAPGDHPWATRLGGAAGAADGAAVTSDSMDSTDTERSDASVMSGDVLQEAAPILGDQQATQAGDSIFLAAVRGVIEGRILGPGDVGFTGDPARDARGRGDHGFGYDPLFIVPDLGRTTAEMNASQKNAISHRGQASRLMFRRLVELVAGSVT